MNTAKLIFKLISGFLLLLLVSCAGVPQTTKGTDLNPQYVSVAQDGTRLAKYAPTFVIEESSKSFNRIGTPAVRQDKNGNPDVYIDPNQPTIYSMEQKFKNKDRNFTNLIYRIHFEATPLYHLTAGKNLGLITVVTLDHNDRPLLVTTVHTCGCYLAIIPTSHLAHQAYPENWPLNGQDVFGEWLPSLLEFKPSLNSQQKLVFWIKSETHRVMDLDLLSENNVIPRVNSVMATLKPMSALKKLPFGETEISFFETDGARKGYVRNSHKPLERLLMSWWSMDWRIGEDKDLGPKEQTGTTFYTSLKFWAWAKSDLWNFENFLKYWGWEL